MRLTIVFLFKWPTPVTQMECQSEDEKWKRLEKKLDALYDRTFQIGRIEEAVLQLHSSMSRQTSLLQELNIRVGSSMAMLEGVQHAVELGQTSTLKQTTSILKKKKSDDVVPVPPAHHDPPSMGIVPGAVKEEGLPKEAPTRRMSVCSQASAPGHKFPRRGVQVLESADVVSVDELSLKTTRKLLRGFSSLSGNFFIDEIKESQERASKKHPSRELVLGKTMNIDLDELRTNHNAFVASQTMRSFHLDDVRTSGMPFVAELLLALTGILKLTSSGLLFRLWAACLLVTWPATSNWLTSFDFVFEKTMFHRIQRSRWLLGLYFPR